MAQAFINYTLDKNEIDNIRRKLTEDELNDSDDQLLVQAAIEAENRINNKRKSTVCNDVENKKTENRKSHV